MSEYSKLIYFIEQQVRKAEHADLFRSWLNMTKEDIMDHKLRDWFASRGLLRLKP